MSRKNVSSFLSVVCDFRRWHIKGEARGTSAVFALAALVLAVMATMIASEMLRAHSAAAPSPILQHEEVPNELLEAR